MIAGLTVALGGLDREVLTEAPKSLLYRMQYWRAASAMIDDHPWWGCGPGNFKQFYTQYKLPEASETVSDPHNFLFEIAATSGLPSLLLFGLIAVAAAWQLGRRRAATAAQAQPSLGRGSEASRLDVTPSGVLPVYAGAGIGIALSLPAGWAGGMPPNRDVLWVTALVAALTLAFVHPWVRHGKLSRSVLLIAVITLLVNLLAAGGIGFPGVAQLLWILLALSLNVSESSDGRTSAASQGTTVSRNVAVVGLAAILVLLPSCYLTMYRPVLAAHELYAEALETSNPQELAERCLAAAQADPWWADPYETYAELLCRQWIEAPSDERLAAFDAAVGNLLQRDRHSSLLYRRYGDWLVQMYLVSGQTKLLDRAIEAHRQAVALYPNSNLLHAQLAWDYYLAGDLGRANDQASEALRLDNVLPHEELKLKHRKLVGGEEVSSKGGHGITSEGANAEQRMREIRSARER